MNRGCILHKHVVHVVVKYEFDYCNMSLDCSLGKKWKQLLFSLDLHSPSFLLGCSILGIEFRVKSPTFGLPMSSQSTVLEIVPAWVSWPFRVPTIAILMTPFLATETKYSIPIQFVMMLAILVSWSPKSWSEYRWKNHLCSSLLQASTRMFEWLATHDLFCGFSFLEKSGLSCTCAIFLYVES